MSIELTPYEIARLAKRRAGRYIAVYLQSLENEMGDDVVICPDCGRKIPTEHFAIARKHILDCVNDYVRALWVILGIEVEGGSHIVE
jgi:hypothetical protein